MLTFRKPHLRTASATPRILGRAPLPPSPHGQPGMAGWHPQHPAGSGM